MLQQLFAPQLVVLYILVASTLYVHFRGRERLRIRAPARRSLDLSRALQCADVCGLGDPNQPVIPVEKFPELKPSRELGDDPRRGRSPVRRGLYPRGGEEQ
jgi:beta-hydroxylase